MATVYKAYDTRLETDVAVKVIRTENILPSVLDRALKRFEREAKALARLTHPNIVKVLDYGEYAGKPYLVMPYLPGGTLKQKLGKQIPWQEAIQILTPILDALGYAHDQNMVHRDVKPSNILLTENGQPMLTDFGIAKVLDLEETQELTATSAAVGTPEYMSPEQATSRTVDHRADIYALGVILYEMITGRKPFIADTPMAVVIKHATEALPRPKQFVPDLSGGVEKVLLKALAKNPADRYQTMAEMGASLEKLVNASAKKSVGREVEIRSGLYHPRQWGFKSILIKSAYLLCLAGLIGTVLFLFSIDSGENHQTGLAVMPTRIMAIFSPTIEFMSSVTSIHFTETVEPRITPTNTETLVPTALPTEIIDAEGIKMVLVPAGEFTMGSDTKLEQQPISQVFVDTFYIDAFEVSNRAYKDCVEANVCQKPKDTSSYTHLNYFGKPEFDFHPVIHIDWNMANTYCEWRGARLPTEAEWEKAARGVDGRHFPWGETVNCGQANYKNDFPTFCVGDTAPIGSYENGQSPYGVYDMAGNVAEWVADWYQSYPGNEAKFSREERVVRGGSWFSFSASMYASYRSSEKPDLHTYGTGFRCAKSVIP